MRTRSRLPAGVPRAPACCPSPSERCAPEASRTEDAHDDAWELDADTRIVGLNVGFGSGWGGGDFQLCVWSDDGGEPLLAIEPYASAGANWRGSQRSFRHRDRDSLRGVRRMVLRAGPADRARLRLIGKGAALNLPALPLAGGNDVTAQLHATGGACWEASFSAPRRNDARTYNARSD